MRSARGKLRNDVLPKRRAGPRSSVAAVSVRLRTAEDANGEPDKKVEAQLRLRSAHDEAEHHNGDRSDHDRKQANPDSDASDHARVTEQLQLCRLEAMPQQEVSLGHEGSIGTTPRQLNPYALGQHAVIQTPDSP